MEKEIYKQKHHYTYDEKLKWWGYGEWVEEPDEVDFIHDDIKCKIIRVVRPKGPIRDDGTFFMFGGHLCGYVIINKDHPFFGKYSEEIENIDVHRGVTFSGNRFDGDNEWWIGFDCAHSIDYQPSIELLKQSYRYLFPIPEKFKEYSIFNPTYKNINFCIEECKSMAEQIKKYHVNS